MSPIKKKRERDNKCVHVTAMTMGSCKDETTTTSGMKSRCVQFSEDSIIYEIPSYEDLKAHEWSRVWYAPEDYRNFNNQCEVSARKLDVSIRLHARRQSPSYGLETWTKDGFRKCLRNRKEAVHVVLEEQFAQWSDGLDDSDSIAELYSARCQHVEMVALTRGLMLEREVQKLQAKAMLESPQLFATLSLNQLSPYIEKMKLLTRSQQYSSSQCHDDDLFSETCTQWRTQSLPKSDDGPTIGVVDCESVIHPPINKYPFSSRIRAGPVLFSPRPASSSSSDKKTKKRKS